MDFVEKFPKSALAFIPSSGILLGSRPGNAGRATTFILTV
jgi:hypothetical protein